MPAPFPFVHVKTVPEAQEALRELLPNGEDHPYVVSFKPEENLRRRLKAEMPSWVVSDFCNTLAERQWGKLRDQLSPVLRAHDLAFLDTFQKNENGEISVERSAHDASWLTTDVSFMIVDGFTRRHVEIFGASLALRPGAKTFLDRFAHRLVVSFGIKDFIRECLAANGLNADIEAAQLLFQGKPDATKDRLIGLVPQTVVVGETKGRRALTWLTRMSCPYAWAVLAIGDDPKLDRQLWQPGALNVLVAPWNNGPNKPPKIDALTEADIVARELTLIVSDLETLNAFLDAHAA